MFRVGFHARGQAGATLEGLGGTLADGAGAGLM